MAGPAALEKGRTRFYATVLLCTLGGLGMLTLRDWACQGAPEAATASASPQPIASASPAPKATGGGETHAGGSLYERVAAYVGKAAHGEQATISFEGLPMDSISDTDRKLDRETQLKAAAGKDLDKAKVAAACVVVTQVDPKSATETIIELDDFFHDRPLKQEHGEIEPAGLGQGALDDCLRMVARNQTFLLPPASN